MILTMSVLDTFLLLVIVAGALHGLRRGFSGLLGAVAGTVFGIILCHAFGDNVADWFNAPDDNFQTRLLHSVLSYGIIFVGTVVAGRLLSSVLAGLIKAVHMGWANRLAGAAFMVLLYTVMLSMALNLWVSVFPDSQLRSGNDKVAETVLDLGPRVLGSETVSEIYDSVHSLSDRINGKGQPEPNKQSER